ncbi:MAG: discoidin domain-containing protein [Pseudobacter sp.]|uniref:discoidin domain-containing protein n=1 Tax=Pseudobacter sp. TaxID=2045420 RepID=UPI003F7FCBC1
MCRINIIVIVSLLMLVTACSKKNEPALLPEGSISFKYTAEKDTVEMPLSILKDSAVVVGMKAILSGSTASSDHWVSFAVDTTKIAEYRSRFGNASLLPTSSWLFHKSMVRIAAGSAETDSAQLNIGLQTKLKEYSTYVLPVVIQSVDGKAEGTATDRVLYFVFKTGKPLFVNKEGWTIHGYSSINGTSNPATILDNDNLTTYWTSNITESMPQWVAINFNRQVTFNAVNYYLPTALRYPTNGGYPTSIQIETSMDGASWTSIGIYEGSIQNNMQSINTGEFTARYLRFTVLASVKYASAYDAIFISGISLVP